MIEQKLPVMQIHRLTLDSLKQTEKLLQVHVLFV